MMSPVAIEGVLKPERPSLRTRCWGMIVLNSELKSRNNIRTWVFLTSGCSQLRWRAEEMASPGELFSRYAHRMVHEMVGVWRSFTTLSQPSWSAGHSLTTHPEMCSGPAAFLAWTFLRGFFKSECLLDRMRDVVLRIKSPQPADSTDGPRWLLIGTFHSPLLSQSRRFCRTSFKIISLIHRLRSASVMSLITPFPCDRERASALSLFPMCARRALVNVLYGLVPLSEARLPAPVRSGYLDVVTEVFFVCLFVLRGFLLAQVRLSVI